MFEDFMEYIEENKQDLNLLDKYNRTPIIWAVFLYFILINDIFTI